MFPYSFNFWLYIYKDLTCFYVTKIFFKIFSPLNTQLTLLLSHSVMSDSLQFHGLQHTRLPYPSPSPGECSDPCPLILWCHPTISFFGAPFSCLQSSPESGSFPICWLFISGGQSTVASASASVLLMNIQDWFPLGLTGLIPLLSKGLSRIFSSTTVWKHQFFGTQTSLLSTSRIHIDYWKNHSFD